MSDKLPAIPRTPEEVQELARLDRERELAPRSERGDGLVKPTKGYLERGWVKHRLIRDIALAEHSGQVLAGMYRCSEQAISQFKKRHALEIDEVRNNLADEYAGVWVAKKLERIRAYQEAAEKMAESQSPRNAEVLTSILKAVSEELGQLPQRTAVQINQQQVEYKIVGIDPEDLT